MKKICLKCGSRNTIKHGLGRNSSQRFLCHQCNSTFTPFGKRGTYSHDFVFNIVDLYCHQNIKVKDIISRFGISSRTLISWKKEHIKNCDFCSQ